MAKTKNRGLQKLLPSHLKWLENTTLWETRRMPLGKNSNEPTGSAVHVWSGSTVGLKWGIYSTHESKNNYCYYLAVINCSSPPGLSTVLGKSLSLRGCLGPDILGKELHSEPCKDEPGLRGAQQGDHVGKMAQHRWTLPDPVLHPGPPHSSVAVTQMAGQESQTSTSLGRKPSRLQLFSILRTLGSTYMLHNYW